MQGNISTGPQKTGVRLWRTPVPPALALALCGVGAAAGCAGRTAPTAPPAPSLEGRFPHVRHRQIACVECHALADVLAGRPAVPGEDDHAPCDRARCHRAEFLAPPGRFCRMCHTRVSAGDAQKTEAAPFPPREGARALAAEFSHAAHLDAATMEQKVGFHVTCTDCHAREGEALRWPDHAVCGRCHTPEAAPAGAPPLSQCSRCHTERAHPPSRTRHFITGDLVFHHAAHRQDRHGKGISCLECHPATARAARTGDPPSPSMSACVSCHDDSDRTPPGKRMRECQTCHTTLQSSIGSIAPRSHLPALERPEDHTRAFRRNHAAEATADPQRCARCHTFMSGSRRDACDDCHQVMRPHDHTVLWREFDHGPAAATRSDSCAVCHQGDFCDACHRVRPRSHFPALDFDASGHGQLARVNLRSCAACHDMTADCSGSGCHPRAP